MVLWRAYTSLLRNYPILAAGCTAGTLMATGDVIAQVAIEKKSAAQYELKRTLRFGFIGLFIAGPGIRCWYVALDKIVTTKAIYGPALKVVMDQACFAPLFLVNFMCLLGLFRGDSFQTIKEKLKRDYPTMLLTNYKIWPPVQLVNFYFVPFQHRILVVNVVALGWNTYFAWMAEKPLSLPPAGSDTLPPS